METIKGNEEMRIFEETNRITLNSKKISTEKDSLLREKRNNCKKQCQNVLEGS